MEGIYFWEKGGVVNGENNIFRKSGWTKMMERIEFFLPGIRLHPG